MVFNAMFEQVYVVPMLKGVVMMKHNRNFNYVKIWPNS